MTGPGAFRFVGSDSETAGAQHHHQADPAHRPDQRAHHRDAGHIDSRRTARARSGTPVAPVMAMRGFRRHDHVHAAPAPGIPAGPPACWRARARRAGRRRSVAACDRGCPGFRLVCPGRRRPRAHGSGRAAASAGRTSASTSRTRRTIGGLQWMVRDINCVANIYSNAARTWRSPYNRRPYERAGLAGPNILGRRWPAAARAKSRRRRDAPTGCSKSRVAFFEADGKTPRPAPTEDLRLWVPYVVGDHLRRTQRGRARARRRSSPT